jgi:hypothetical protein
MASIRALSSLEFYLWEQGLGCDVVHLPTLLTKLPLGAFGRSGSRVFTASFVLFAKELSNLFDFEVSAASRGHREAVAETIGGGRSRDELAGSVGWDAACRTNP